MSVAFLEPHEAAQLLRVHEAVLVDLRAAASYQRMHVPYALSLPWGDPAHEVWLSEQAPAVWILMSHRSRLAIKVAEKLMSILPAHPDQRVFVMRGGLAAWRRSGFPVVANDSGVLSRMWFNIFGN